MREMKDSGIEWIGEIPVNWAKTRIGNLFRFSSGDSLTNEEIQDEGLYKVYGANGPRGYYHHTNLAGKHILIGRVGALCGNIHVVDEPVWVTEHALIAEQISPDVCTDFAGRVFESMNLGQYSKASAQPVIASSVVQRLQIPIPPSLEQRRIADYLDRKCSQIDAIIARQQEVIEKLKAYKLSVITETVTKGLNPDVPMKDSGVEWIGEIPEHWEVMRFGRCAAIKSNLVAPDDYADYPQISPDSIEKNSGRILEYKTVKESGVISWNHLFFKGQIIYSKIRPMLNKVAIAPFDGLCSADMYPIETNNNTQFLVYMMLSDYFTSQVGLVTENRVKMPKINQNELGAIMVTIPPQSEQETISKYLLEKCLSIDTVIDKKQGLIGKLIDYKKSLIYEVVTGKKEV